MVGGGRWWGVLQWAVGLPRCGAVPRGEWWSDTAGRGSPPEHNSQHGDGGQQEEGQGPQDGPDYQGESLGQLGGQLTCGTSHPGSHVGKASPAHTPTYPALPAPALGRPHTQRPAARPRDYPQPLVWRVLGEGSRPGGPLASPHRSRRCPSPSRLPLTLRQRLEIDLAPIGAVACGGPRPHLEAIDVARAQLRHRGRVGLAGQGEGMGFIFCLGVTAVHSLLPRPRPSPLLTPLRLPGTSRPHLSPRWGTGSSPSPAGHPPPPPLQPGHSSGADSPGYSR